MRYSRGYSRSAFKADDLCEFCRAISFFAALGGNSKSNNSILFPDVCHVPTGTQDVPDYFSDTNLDQIIDSVTAGKKGYDLKPFFYTRLRETDTIHYRHEVFRDFADEKFFEQIKLSAKSFIPWRKTTAGYLKISSDPTAPIIILRKVTSLIRLKVTVIWFRFWRRL